MTAIRNWLAICCVLVAALITAPVGHSQFNGCGPGLCQGSAVFPLSGASIDLDFANNRTFGCNTFLDCLSITRATPATSYAQTSSGTLTGFTANTLRMTDLGLLIEEARTNLALKSQDYTDTVTWPDVGAATTRTAASTVAPDGTLTGQLVADNATTGSQNYGPKQTITVVNGSTYVAFAIIKYRNWQYVQINASTTTNHYGYFDVQNGAVAGTPSGLVNQGIIALTNGWYICWITFTASTTTAVLTILPTNSTVPAGRSGVVGNGTYFWGSDLDLGSFPTSYIPTTTASVTRAADVVTFLDPLLSYLQGTRGTVYTTTNGAKWDSAHQFTRVLGSSNADAVNMIAIDNSNTGIQTYNGATGGNQKLGTTFSGSWASRVKAAHAWAPSVRRLTANGAAGVSDANGRGTITNLRLGANGGGDAPLNGYLERLSYVNTDHSLSQMATLTQ